MFRQTIAQAFATIIWLSLAAAPTWAAAGATQPSWFPKRICKLADDSSPARRATCYRPWTLLVFMAADNDLNPYAVYDMLEMESLKMGSPRRADAVVEVLNREQQNAARYWVRPQAKGDEFTPPAAEFLPHLTLQDIKSQPIARVERSQQNGEALRNFLHWGARAFPAQHYMVIVWGHGQGWTAAIEKSRVGGIGWNEARESGLGIPELQKILHAFKAEELENKRDIAVYASDACLMQSAEVTYELSQDTRFVVGSAQIQTYLGLPYREMLREIDSARFAGLKSKLKMADEPYLVARMLPLLTRQSMQAGGLHGRLRPDDSAQFTMSAITSWQMRNRLVPRLQQLAVALGDAIHKEPGLASDFSDLFEQAPTFLGNMREMGSWVGLLEWQLGQPESRLAKSPGAAAILAAVQEVRIELQNTVLEYSYGDEYITGDSPYHLLGFRALSVWIPSMPEQFQSRLPDFQQSSFFKAFASGEWQGWLTQLFQN